MELLCFRAWGLFTDDFHVKGDGVRRGPAPYRGVWEKLARSERQLITMQKEWN